MSLRRHKKVVLVLPTYFSMFKCYFSIHNLSLVFIGLYVDLSHKLVHRCGLEASDGFKNLTVKNMKGMVCIIFNAVKSSTACCLHYSTNRVSVIAAVLLQVFQMLFGKESSPSTRDVLKK